MLEKYPRERCVFYFDCTALLGSGETISGVPEFESFPKLNSGSAALTFESPIVNTNPVTLPGGTVVAVGKLLTAIISGGQSATDKDARIYSITATISTSAGNTLVSKSLLKVLPVGPAS
jgi:hypothetical protein